MAVDITDLRTKKSGLSSFTVYRSRNGGTATVYTTPTVTELSSANMLGLYSLLIDEDTTIASGSDSEEYAVYITQASMAPVARTIELYRREVTTGNQILVDSNGRLDVIKVAGTTQTAGDLAATQTTIAGYIDTEVAAIKTQTDKMTFTVANQLDVNVLDWKSSTAPAMTGDAYARLGAPAGASHAADVAAVKTVVDAVKTKTDSLTFTVTNQADVNVIDWKGATAPAMTGDAFARLGAPAGASHAADVAAVKVDTAAVKAKTDNLPAAPSAVGDIPTANQNADALLDRADAVETGWTLRKALRILTAFAAGKTSGMGTSAPVFRNITDSKNRISATLDVDNNRTAVTSDGT
jgi:hypothetical protein